MQSLNFERDPFLELNHSAKNMDTNKPMMFIASKKQLQKEGRLDPNQTLCYSIHDKINLSNVRTAEEESSMIFSLEIE